MNRFTEFDLVTKPLTPIAGYWTYPIVPLEQALAPFLSKINQLARSIKEAKKHCRNPSDHGLSRDESAAVFLYTVEAGDDSLYRILNKVLRDEDRSIAKQWFHYLKLFDSALEKLPTKKGCIWRGVPGDLSHYFQENDLITWWSITSCSLSAKEAEKFLGKDDISTLFMIEAIHGKDVSGYTVFQNEKEIVLGIGTQFRVKSNPVERGNLIVVHLAEVDSDEEELPTAIAKMDLTVKSSDKSK